MASFVIGDEDAKLIETYKNLEAEKHALEKAIAKMKAKQSARLNRVKTSQQNGNDYREMHMKELLQAYRMTGASVIEVSGPKQTILYDTCYKDQFYESYLLEVNKEQKRIISHNMPPFIPCEALVHKYWRHDFSLFTSAINDHICTYVRRRQQWLAAEKILQPYFAKNTEFSSAYDYIRFDLTFRISNFITIILNYKLDQDLPDKATVLIHHTDSTLHTWCEDTFTKQYLEVAAQLLADRLS